MPTLHRTATSLRPHNNHWEEICQIAVWSPGVRKKKLLCNCNTDFTALLRRSDVLLLGK